MINIGFLLLAAGGSSRLGRAKQLLEWQGKTLLTHALDKAADLNFSQRLVVYGARKLEMERHLDQMDIPIVYNPDWSKGMSTSIKKGLETLLENQADLAAIFLCLVDQPLINQDHIKSMLGLHETYPQAIISAAYQDTFGVPAIFPKAFFPALKMLEEQGGAKKIIKKYQNSVISFPCPEAAFDVDTETDYAHLLKLKLH